MKYILILIIIFITISVYIEYHRYRNVENRDIVQYREQLNNYSLESNSRLIARVLYAEANGESDIDKIAVRSSILNRVDNIEFPSSIDSVIYQKNQYAIANKFTKHDLQIATCLLEDYFRDCNIMYFFNPKTITNKVHLKNIRKKELILKTKNHEYY